MKLLMLYDDTIHDIATAPQVSELGGEQPGVVLLAANDA